MKKIGPLFCLLSFIGCAGTTCPGTLQEPVSLCRARKECGGAGTAIGMIFDGAGSANSGQPNYAQQNYQNCLDRSMESQRANAGIQSTTQHCTIRQVSSDTYKSVCD